MEALLGRYRNLTVLVVVVVAQLLYLAYQVKTNGDERLIRVWAVTAVTPMAGIVEAVRGNTIGFLQDYFILLDVREQNRRLKSDNDKLRMENVYFRNQLATAENARALTMFQAQIPSKTVAARIIGNSTVATAKAVFIDRGSSSGIENGMAVVTPEGVVGKVSATYPLVSQVLLVTDPTFGVGIESQKGRVHGVLNCSAGKCIVAQIQNEDKVDVGEWFFTSGEDRIFPKGFPVGVASAVQLGQGMKDVKLSLSGAPGGAEEVLVVLQGVHRDIPTVPVVERSNATLLPPPPAEGGPNGQQNPKPQTEADKILQRYAQIGKEQNHSYGAYGSNMPNFNPKAVTPQPGAAKAAAAPSILGARSDAPQPALQKPELSGPVLPLGAPRRKSGADSQPNQLQPKHE
jgi:rod shape-determining protein MreC